LLCVVRSFVESLVLLKPSVASRFFTGRFEGTWAICSYQFNI